MKLNKCFTTVFDAPLKERGFKKKGTLYYRMNGEILQGITLKSMNPYMISYNYFPYWAYENRKIYDTVLSKGYWAENHGVTGDYYRQDEEEEMLTEMEARKDIFCNVIIPALDKVNDLDSYIELSISKDFDKTLSELSDWNRFLLLRHWNCVNKYDLLVKGSRDGSFEKVKEIEAMLLEEHVNVLLREHPDSFTKEKIEEDFNKYWADLHEAMQNNDFNAGAEYCNQRCEKMKQRLLDELKLKIE